VDSPEAFLGPAGQATYFAPGDRLLLARSSQGTIGGILRTPPKSENLFFTVSYWTIYVKHQVLQRESNSQQAHRLPAFNRR
jgi:hypothetical protein